MPDPTNSTPASIEDLVARLRQPLGREETMQAWDHWRRLMKQTRSSLPRDAFEAWCELQDEEERFPAASALSSAQAEIERLRADCIKLGDSEVVAHCEGCGAWLLDGDDFVSDPDSVAGCWAAMTDLPSKRERPCYAYRVGKPDARTALKGGGHHG